MTADIGVLAVKRCEGLGFDEAEAFVQKRRTTEIVLERGEVQSERAKTRMGIGIRAVKDKKLGFVHSSILEKSVIQRICRDALRLAQVSRPNSEWVSLPLHKAPRTPFGIFDQELDNLSPEDLLDLAIVGYDAVKEADPRVSIDGGKLSASTVETSVVNSHGISLQEKETILSFYLVCVAKENEEASSFAYKYDISRTLKDFSPEKVGELAAREAAASLNPQSIESFQGEAIFSADVAANVLFGPVTSSVNADNVQRGRSIWTKKIGETVSFPKLSLADDGLLPYGVGSSSFDAEGVPSQKTLIVENGVLRKFLYDSYTAHKKGVESTGNAARSDYSALPSISISNLLVEPGSKTLDDLISQVDRGIVINRFSGNVNPQNGDFSGVAKQASFVEKGEIKFPLRETMISGNAFQALNSIVEIGSERRPTLAGVYTPPILLANMQTVTR